MLYVFLIVDNFFMGVLWKQIEKSLFLARFF